MINFFRKIRKKLADDNKPMKYTRYAIGEIILVVIGILIALQINDWNERRKIAETEAKYIQGLILNLEEDIKSLKNMSMQNDLKIFSATYIANYFYKEEINRNASKLSEHILRLYDVQWFSSQDFVFEGIKSAGNLNYIASDELLFETLSYYNLTKEVVEKLKIDHDLSMTGFNDNDFNDHIDNTSIIEPLFSGSVRSRFEVFDDSFFTSDPNATSVKKFRNMLSLIKGILGRNRINYNRLRANAELLKNRLSLYLPDKYKSQLLVTSKGHPKVLTNGKSTNHKIGFQDGEALNNWLEHMEGELFIDFPADLGYGVVRFNDLIMNDQNISKVDYTDFNSISLEMKGQKGGESITIAFLDSDDTGDGSEIHIPIELTNQWNTYTLDLSLFERTDFSSVIESPALVLGNTAVSFSIKNIEFIKN